MGDTESLAAGLAEFGLSQYEARAYVALLAEGTATAGELAYRAEIPRTKVYPVMLRLEKKGLATVGGKKPVTCSAVPPEESLEGSIKAQIDKVNSMNTLVSGLRSVSDGARRLRGTEERKYSHIGHAGVLASAQEMVGGASLSVHAVVDDAGLGVIAECAEAVVAAVRRGADVKMVITPEAIGADLMQKIPRGVEVRIARSGHNCMILDGAGVLVLGGDAGRAAALESSPIVGADLERAFEMLWEDAIPAGPLLSLGNDAAQEAYRAIVLVGRAGLGHALGSAITRTRGGMAALLDDNGIDMGGRKLDDVICLANAAVRATCDGHVSVDEKSGSILVESGLNSGHSLPWARIIEGYLESHGVKTRLVYQAGARRGERVHIKMAGAKRGAASGHKSGQ